MSEVLGSSLKKPRCGDMFTLSDRMAVIRDVLGGIVNFQVVGTDPDIVQPVNGATMPDDYKPGLTLSTVNLDTNGKGYPRVNPDGTFVITIETDEATYVVVLADGSQYTITAAQSTAYLGRWYPARLLAVLKNGTTGSFSVGY